LSGNLIEPALAGFLLGGGLIIAIGAQNAFVLRLGIVKQHVFTVVMICALSDALLIVVGVGGFGTLVQSSPNLITAVTLFGSAFLIIYGGLAFRRSFQRHSLQTTNIKITSLGKTIATVLGLTFLNPHVYLDTVVLLGGLSAQYSGNAKLAFGAGAVIASFMWFFALGYGARILAPLFAKPMSWRILEFLIGIVMWSIAAKLLYSHFQPSGFLSPAGS